MCTVFISVFSYNFCIGYECVSPEFLWGLNFIIICEIWNWYFGSAAGEGGKYTNFVLFEYQTYSLDRG